MNRRMPGDPVVGDDYPGDADPVFSAVYLGRSDITGNHRHHILIRDHPSDGDAIGRTWRYMDKEHIKWGPHE